MCRRSMTICKPMLQAAPDGVLPEIEPLVQKVRQVEHAWPAVQTDHVHVHPERTFERCRREQVRHELLGIDAPFLADDEPDGFLVIRFVPQVVDLRQLLRAHLCRDLLEHLAAGDLVGERGHDDIAALDTVRGAQAQGAGAVPVDIADLRTRRYDFPAGREIRSPDVLHQVRDARFRCVHEVHQRARHFTKIVRRNVGRHADRDAGRAVQQQVRQPRRQHHRLLERAVEIRRPVDGALGQFLQQASGIRREPRLGVAHRGKRFRVVRRTPVPLPVYHRVPIREVLRHQHHRFVARGVAVRMKLADHVADGPCRLLRFGAGRQPEFAHRIDDAPLHRLQAVPERRQGTIQDDVHRVIEVGFFGVFAERLLLDAFEIK